jgi:hypothetical protein
MEWKRTGRHTAFVFLVFFPIASIGLAGVVMPIAQGRVVWAVRDRRFGSGPASRTDPLTTPAGKENVAAWVGRIGRKEGKTKSLHAYCTIAAVDGLVVGQRMLHDWDSPGTFALRETPPGDELTTFDFEPGAIAIAPPAAAKAACAAISYPDDATYDETMIRMGSEVEVSGCYWKDALTPCRDGADLVTVRRARDRFSAARSTGIVTELFCMFFTGLPLSFLGFAIAGERIMLNRRKKKPKTSESEASG